MKFVPSKDAQDLWEIDEDMAADSLLYAYDMDETPMPWDADISVEGDKVTLEGSLVGGSSNNYKASGYCKIEASIDLFKKLYYIEIPDIYLNPDRDNGESESDLLEALKGSGWVVVK